MACRFSRFASQSVFPCVVLLTVTSFESLAGLYAIGVVGAITVNLGSCAMNRTIGFTWYDRVLFGVTFVILALGRVDPRAHKAGRTLLCNVHSWRGSGTARLYAKTTGTHDDDGDASGRCHGFT